MANLIGLDIGSTSLKAVLLDSDTGKVIQTASRPTPVLHPLPERSEHDPESLWQSAAVCLREVMQSTGNPLVSGLAISSMAEAGVPLDREMHPVAPIIAWYDRRSEPQAAWIEQQMDISSLYAITGQRVSPSFAVTKILWLRDHEPQAYDRIAHWLPVPSYLLWRLTGEMAVDYTIASRTLLFDQNTLDWSPRLLEVFGVKAEILPPVHPGGTLIGMINAQAALETGLPEGTPCFTGGHDHLCATLASGATLPGAAADSTGSAQALIMLLPRFQPRTSLAEGGYAYYAYLLRSIFALKGGMKAAGSGMEWLVRQLTSPGGELNYRRLEQEAWQGIGKKAGPLWLPHLIGSGSPQGDRFSRAAMVGVQFEHSQGDLFRGMLEALACWMRHNLEEMQSQTGIAVHQVTLTGGVTRLRLLSQLKADVIRLPMLVPEIPESAAVGAALLAGLGAGVFDHPSEAVQSLKYPCAIFQPDPVRTEWYEELYHQVYRPLYASLSQVNTALTRMEQKSAGRR